MLLFNIEKCREMSLDSSVPTSSTLSFGKEGNIIIIISNLLNTEVMSEMTKNLLIH